jgi:hypothetical protein
MCRESQAAEHRVAADGAPACAPLNSGRYAARRGQEVAMSNFGQGVVGGLIFGGLSVALMLPMSFPDKQSALLGAFLNRFAIGLVIGCVQLPWSGWVVGLIFGVLISLPDAIITKAYAPILIVGAVGGLIIGGLIHGWKGAA